MDDPYQLTLRIDHASAEARQWEARFSALLREAAGQPWLRLLSGMSVYDDEPGPELSRRAQEELGFRVVRSGPEKSG